jgi:DNA mismatch repair ATPase MutS
MSEDPPTDQSLDSGHVDTLLKARLRAGDKLPTTVRVFERNDFYYFFDADGELAATKVYGSVTAMKSMGGGSESVNFCVMNQANFESVLRHIVLVRHLRVEIFKFVAAKGGKPATYELAVRYSEVKIFGTGTVPVCSGTVPEYGTLFHLKIGVPP